jgi:two-component system, OmpR family, phosphate regulon sensor histidine kinase PhoR
LSAEVMARRYSLFQQILPVVLVVTVVAAALVGIAVAVSMRSFYYRQVVALLETRAAIVREHVCALGALGERRAEIDALCKRLAGQAGTRVTVVLASGRVIGDGWEQPAQMGDHANRPEIQAALRGGTGTAVRGSATVRRRLLYVAVPVREEGLVTGAVRTALPMAGLEEALRGTLLRMGFAGLLLGACAAAAGLVLARRITRPLADLCRGTERFAGGDLAFHLPEAGSEEMVKLAAAMNGMARQLRERMDALRQEQNERAAVLASMEEGVIAVDGEQRVLHVNPAAARILNLDVANVRGRLIQEVVRHGALHAFVRELLDSGLPRVAELRFEAGQELLIRARGTPLLGGKGARIGGLVVLYDVTRERRLQQTRTDFVANVSHELKTPVTAIKGFTETLRGGAVEDCSVRDRFLEKIERHADRLDSIIADLLGLSRIEHLASERSMEFAPVNLSGVFRSVADMSREAAQGRGQVLEWTCDEALTVRGNRPLLEQAVFNLVDNALKYSGTAARVNVSAERVGETITIAVADTGTGIQARHLPRIFERFYRVDKGRSREAGGTGLGLGDRQAHRPGARGHGWRGKHAGQRQHIPDSASGRIARPDLTEFSQSPRSALIEFLFNPIPVSGAWRPCTGRPTSNKEGQGTRAWTNGFGNGPVRS